MPLYRDGGFVEDDWLFPPDDAPLPASGKVAVSKARFSAERDTLLARSEAIGVVLEAGDRLDDIAADLSRLALIAIRFPKFGDGRPYSLARLLRDRHGFRSELRATGDVLRDQIVPMLRAGFDALEPSHPGTIAALHEKRIVAVSHHYQPAAAGVSEKAPDRHPWRRISVALP
ncbi:Oxidoreductase probably involved in sulfite reduction [Rhodovulum sp. PH10]|uniref:DUF934 domain-containing protein n=1 Tax=Rhodovulum sp. PH10 TaxID=1187851 RepID=UPI00027C2556|nr:DUF934 domain-containing protein [Rhodovulum sp. PH10]EJW10788.1 Oxidoreductase probably involved in sulfite reduction [Rhodovulum sp. PH10]